MIVDPRDDILINDYIHTIKQQEIVLWEGKMAPIELTNRWLKNEILFQLPLLFLLIGMAIATFLIHVGLTLMIGYLFFLEKQQNLIRQNKLKYSHYIITPKQCIFIHCHKQQIHINNTPTHSIQKTSTYRTPKGEISVFLHTNQPTEFEMFYYTDHTKTSSIGFVNVGRQASTITKVIRDQVLKEI